MAAFLDLFLMFTSSQTERTFNMTLRCDALGLGPVSGTLSDPLTQRERELLRWYLEEYWKWPYDEFERRGKQIEELLVEIGKRLYTAVSSAPEANSVVQAWRLQPDAERQISIMSDVPAMLSIPWELLHDDQGFLALRTRQPVAILRRLPQCELAAFPTSFEPPLRVLLVTARPENTGFVDPRGIARELVEALQNHSGLGSIELEFLRPPTLAALRKRLAAAKAPPVHIMHFDGHGTIEGWGESGLSALRSDDGRGQLAFEDENGELDTVPAETLAQVLQDSGVKLAVLTACQSALGRGDDAFSSVAAQLIRSGVDAVAAMSSSILVASSVRYAEAFYDAIGSGLSAPVAQERARQALHDNPRRHIHRRRRDEEGQPVELHDWWLPHFYQQRAVKLQPTVRKRRKKRAPSSIVRFSPTIPDPPRYGFGGRARELLQVERWLLRKKLVIIHGFGGIGKTALVREVADWLTRTGMYTTAYLHSFEHGGDATTLLSALGHFLGVYGSTYDPTDAKAAVHALRQVLRVRPLLLIADNLESVMPGGEAALASPASTALWNLLVELKDNGIGVIITSRSTKFGDARMAGGRHSALLPLAGLDPEDAYALATRLLLELNVDRHRVPYAGLRDLLAQLDHHPLAIQLVLPALRDYTLDSIREDFHKLLPQFSDDLESGRNRSLLASLDYSLQRLNETERTMLQRLTPFESGGVEIGIPAVTRMSEDEWGNLRIKLEQAALIMPEQIHDTLVEIPFIRFHPVLTPYLRAQRGLDADTVRDLNVQYINFYYMVGTQSQGAKKETTSDEQGFTEFLRCEIPNFRRTLRMLVERRDVARASTLGECMANWFRQWGWLRERDELHEWLEQAIKAAASIPEDKLTERAWMVEHGLAQRNVSSNDFASAERRYSDLLIRIEELPEADLLGPRSDTHFRTLYELANTLRDSGQWAAAQRTIRRALDLLKELVSERPDKGDLSQRWKLQFLNVLGDILFFQNDNAGARAAYDEALNMLPPGHDVAFRARLQAQLGSVALNIGDYESARIGLTEAIGLFRSWGDRASEAVAWNQLGQVEYAQKLWLEAERCYREALAIEEQQGNQTKAATSYINLALVAKGDGRYAEAEGWYGRALAVPDLPVHVLAALRRNYVQFLLDEIKAGRASQHRLSEARSIAEQALATQESLDTASDIWRILSHLATIAEMDGRPDAAREYRLREHKAAVASDEIRRVVDESMGEMISLIAAAIVQHSSDIEPILDMVQGAFGFGGLNENFSQVGPVVRRIWKGERDWESLTDGLNRLEVVVIARVLETIAQLSAAEMTPEQLVASLPSAIRDAIAREDEASLQGATQALSPFEKQALLSALKGIKKPSIEESFKPLAWAVAQVALGNESSRIDVERVLTTLPDGLRLRDVVRRIWTGERNSEVLTENLSDISKEIILLVLRTISEVGNTIDQVLSEFEDFGRAIAMAAVVGTEKQRNDIEAMLSGSQVSGPLLDTIRRVLAGERDLAKLATGLTLGNISIVRRLLKHVNELAELVDRVVGDNEPLLREIAAVALGDESKRTKTRAAVVQLEQSDIHLSDAVERIWSGERDPDALTAGVGVVDTFLVHRLLKLVAKPLPTVQSFLKSPEPYLRVIAKIAGGDENHREEIEYLLDEGENNGLEIRDAVHKIWAGERDRAALTKELTARDARMVCRILEILSQPVEGASKTPEEVLASLPSNVRDAWERGDEAALQYAGLFLPAEEKDRIRGVLRWITEHENADLVQAGLPLLEKIAAAALGMSEAVSVEEFLPNLEAMGIRIGEAAGRICAGERNAAALTKGLNQVDTVLVNSVLELIQIMPRVPLIAFVALGDETPRSEIESLLLDLQTRGSGLRQAVHRIWAGERDSAALSAALDPVSGRVVAQILKTIDDTLKAMEPFLEMVAAVARGDETRRDLVETLLEKVPESADLREAVQRIWAGERNPSLLTKKLNGFYSSLVMRMLDSLGPAVA